MQEMKDGINCCSCERKCMLNYVPKATPIPNPHNKSAVKENMVKVFKRRVTDHA